MLESERLRAVLCLMPPFLVANALVILPSVDAEARASLESWGRKKCASFFTRATSTELRILLQHRSKVPSKNHKYALATALTSMLKKHGLVLGEQEFEQQLLAEEALAASLHAVLYFLRQVPRPGMVRSLHCSHAYCSHAYCSHAVRAVQGASVCRDGVRRLLVACNPARSSGGTTTRTAAVRSCLCAARQRPRAESSGDAAT